MPDTPLEYDKIIWTVFSVGVISSVVILYNVNQGGINGEIYKLMALVLGFFILTYSFILIRGYGWKKKCLQSMPENQELRRRINSKPYFRTRWMGESILGLIGIYYFVVFCSIEIWSITIPVIIALFFAFLSSVANITKS